MKSEFVCVRNRDGKQQQKKKSSESGSEKANVKHNEIDFIFV